MATGDITYFGPIKVNNVSPDSTGNIIVDVSLDSPALSGIPTAPTASIGTNTDQIATTAFVLANGGSGGSGTLTITDNNTASGTSYVPFLSVTSGSVSELTVASTKLQFQPSTGILSATTFNSTSDIRKKTNINDLTYGLNDVVKLIPKSFNFIHSGKESIGFIAQDVVDIIPELVIADSEGFLGINYGSVTAVLVNAIKDLKMEIDSLKDKINNTYTTKEKL